MGRTNVVIDDELVNECQKLTGSRIRRALIDYALHEVRRRGRQKRLLELKGTIQWEGDLAEWREADIYRSLRKKGINIRKPVDCMIASVAMEYDIHLLHNDRDFDPIAKHLKLRIYG